MSSWGLKYYPLCGFPTRFGKADNFGFKEQGTKDPRTRRLLGYLSSLFFLFFRGAGDVFFGAGGGRVSLFQVQLLIFLGHPFVFTPRAFINPMWTLCAREGFLEACLQA